MGADSGTGRRIVQEEGGEEAERDSPLPNSGRWGRGSPWASQRKRKRDFSHPQADRFIPQKTCGMEKRAQERSGKKKSACSVRNDGVGWVRSGGVGDPRRSGRNEKLENGNEKKEKKKLPPFPTGVGKDGAPTDLREGPTCGRAFRFFGGK